MNSWANYENPTSVPKYRSTTGGRINGFSIIPVGTVTGGTATLTVDGTNYTVQWNQTATGLEGVLIAGGGIFAEGNVACRGGTANLAPLTVAFAGNILQRRPAVSINSASITGGGSLVIGEAMLPAHVDTPFRADQPYGGGIVYDPTATSEVTAGASTTTSMNTWSLRPGKQSLRIVGTNAAANTDFYRNTGVARPNNTLFGVAWRHLNNTRQDCTLIMSQGTVGGGTDTSLSFSVSPGLSCAFGNFTNIGSATLSTDVSPQTFYCRANPYTGQAYYQSSGQSELFTDQIFVPTGGAPRLIIGFDDFASTSLDAVAILSEYDKRAADKITFFGAKSLANTGGKLTDAQIIANVVGKYEIGSHSDAHVNFTYAVDPAATGDYSVWGLAWTSGSPAAAIVLNFGSGRTLTVNQTDTVKAVETAIRALSPALPISYVETNIFSNGTMGGGVGFRFVFSSNIPAPTIDSGGAGWTFGRGYTRARIAEDWLSCKTWLASLGAPDTRVGATPFGNLCRDYYDALTLDAGYDAIFLGAAVNGESCTYHPTFAGFGRGRIPGVNISNAATSPRETIRKIVDASHIGMSLRLIGHEVSASATSGLNINTADWRTLCEFIGQYNGSLFEVVTAREFVDEMRDLSPGRQFTNYDYFGNLR